MKKALLLLSFVHLLAACTNDIEILPNDESQKLIVNALINANKTNNAIFLALSGYHEPQVVKNGIIHLYINNVLSETISECTYRPNNDSPLDYQNYFYQISSRFKTGDQVRIEVETKDGKYKANAEATVYEPIEIIKADTIESNHSLSETSESLWIYQATKWKIKLQTPTTNHSQYYRVNIKQTYTYRLTNRKTLQDSTAISTQWECSGYYDTALMDGKPGTPNNSDPIDGWNALTSSGTWSYQSMKIRPQQLNSIFEPQVSGKNCSVAYDQLLCNVNFQVYAVQNLDRNGLPY